MVAVSSRRGDVVGGRRDVSKALQYGPLPRRGIFQTKMGWKQVAELDCKTSKLQDTYGQKEKN